MNSVGFSTWMVFFCFSIPLAGASTLRIAIGDTPSVFDWTQSTSLKETPIYLNTQRGLMGNNFGTKKVFFDVAESLIVSADYKEYIFKIKKTAKWSDGRPILAQDFVYGWFRLISPHSTSAYVRYLFDIKNAEEYNGGKISDSDDVGIHAIDDATLKITLNKSYVNWEEITTLWPLYPVRKDQIEKFGENWSRPGVQLSTGSYVIKTYDVDKKLTLIKNPYFNRAKVDQIDILYNQNIENSLKLFLNKNVDIVTDIPQNEVKKYSKMSELVKTGGSRLIYLTANFNRYPMSNIKFRESIFRALDHSNLVINKGLYKTANSFFPSDFTNLKNPVLPEKNSIASKKALKESGVIANQKFKLKILAYGIEPFISIANEIEKTLAKNLSINVEVNLLKEANFDTTLSLGTYDVLIYGWTPKLNTPFDYLALFSKRGKSASINYHNAEYERLLSEYISTSNLKAKNKTLIQAQHYLIKNQFAIYPILYMYDFSLIQKSVKNFHLSHLGTFDLNDAFVQ